jgi:transcriptional regulator with XRE-family HTH domain
MIQKIRQDRTLGDNLRDLRIKNGFSQEKLCAELQRRGCDIARSAYAKYEAGELNVKVSVILALKNIYNCQYDDFFAGLEIEQND